MLFFIVFKNICGTSSKILQRQRKISSELIFDQHLIFKKVYVPRRIVGVLLFDICWTLLKVLIDLGFLTDSV